MSDPRKKTAEELRLAIALQRGYTPVHQTIGGIKLLRLQPQPTSAFALPRSNEAPDWPNDIAAAFRLISNEFSHPDQHVVIERIEAVWRCALVDGQRLYESQGESAALAICRTYLLATAEEE